MKPIDLLFKKSIDSVDVNRAALEERLTLIQSVRLLFLCAILFLTVLVQSLQTEFLNPGWIPIYLVLALSFVINCVLLLNFKFTFSNWIANTFAFAYDAVVVTCLIYFTGVNHSIFLFLYLVYIILSGLVYKRNGAVLMALWTSTLFSFLLVFEPSLRGKGLYFAIAINNLAFFTVAVLSGILSEQIDFIGGKLEEKGKELTALKDFNQVIVDNVGSGFLTIDKDFNISHVNRSASKILEDFTLLGKHLKNVFPQLNQALLNGEFVADSHLVHRIYEHYINFRQEKLTIECVTSQVKDTEDGSVGYVVMFQDLTEVKRMEFNLRQQEKLAAVGQLAAGIAHEIRNPLASISGSIQMLGTSDFTEEENSRLMNIVLKEIDRLNNLISEFLEFVKPNQIMEDSVQVNTVLKDVLEMIETNNNLPANIEQNIELKSTNVILGDYSKLKQAFLNIIINAYQAMDGKGTPLLKVQTYDSGDKVIVKIQDHGCGMDENNIRRVFEPFHTTKARGTGLGMAITHKILESHGAEIFIESELGRGTLFTLEFPDGKDHPQENQQKVALSS